jgi:hypothetical protein
MSLPITKNWLMFVGKIQPKTDPNELKEELEVRRKQIMEDAQEYLRLLNLKRIFENAERIPN